MAMNTWLSQQKAILFTVTHCVRMPILQRNRGLESCLLGVSLVKAEPGIETMAGKKENHHSHEAPSSCQSSFHGPKGPCIKETSVGIQHSFY